MLDARFRPLPKWTRKPNLAMRGSPFNTPYNKTLDKLEYELNKLRSKNVLIEAGFPLEDLRNDGWPRGGTRPMHPGVVLYFQGTDGAMEFPCGTYHRFEANLHAIALTLENLRAIDRYGVTLGHQQYLGFRAIEAPKQMTVEDAAESISGDKAAIIITDIEAYRSAYRAKARIVHPDTPGASGLDWARLQDAKAILDKHHGLTTPEQRT